MSTSSLLGFPSLRIQVLLTAGLTLFLALFCASCLEGDEKLGDFPPVDVSDLSPEAAAKVRQLDDLLARSNCSPEARQFALDVAADRARDGDLGFVDKQIANWSSLIDLLATSGNARPPDAIEATVVDTGELPDNFLEFLPLDFDLGGGLTNDFDLSMTNDMSNGEGGDDDGGDDGGGGGMPDPTPPLFCQDASSCVTPTITTMPAIPVSGSATQASASFVNTCGYDVNVTLAAYLDSGGLLSTFTLLVPGSGSASHTFNYSAGDDYGEIRWAAVNAITASGDSCVAPVSKR